MLDNLHALRFVHRDIKPSNILVLSNGGCLLNDFGQCIEPDRYEHYGTETFVASGRGTIRIDRWTTGYLWR